MAKYKLTKTVVSKSNKTETTTPKIKRFTKEQAKKWVATRKAKLGSGVFRNYGTKESSDFSLSANPPAVVVWEFEKVANTAPERKKHSVKRSALKNKETVRRKKPEAKTKDEIKRFEVGKTYTDEYSYDGYDQSVEITVIKRTAKTLTYKQTGYTKPKTSKIYTAENKYEYVKSKHGTFYWYATKEYKPKQSNDFAPARKSHKVNLSALRKKYKAIKRNAQKTQKEQFDEIKTKHPQYLILFRKGDTFVTYGDDVKKLENVVGHTSFPATDFARWINVLIKWGYKVAVIGSTNANN